MRLAGIDVQREDEKLVNRRGRGGEQRGRQQVRSAVRSTLRPLRPLRFKAVENVGPEPRANPNHRLPAPQNKEGTSPTSELKRKDGCQHGRTCREGHWESVSHEEQSAR